MYREWGNGADIGAVYLYKEEDKDRMGNCQRLPKDGDLCLCYAHSGDCFYNYKVLHKLKNGKYKVTFDFSAYCFGKECFTVTDKDFHLLLGGMEIKIKEQ